MTRAKYFFVAEHTNKNDFINDFLRLKEALIQKYGTPVIDDRIWRKTLYQDTQEHWRTAISRGDLVYLAIWKTERTEISTYLSGENYGIKHQIEYQRKALKSLEKR